MRQCRQAGLGHAKVGPGCLFRFFLYCLLICLLFPLRIIPINFQLWGTRGYIPDSSPRGYVGLVESCIVSPKISIAELALYYILHELNKYTTVIDNILESYVGSMSRTDI